MMITCEWCGASTISDSSYKAPSDAFASRDSEFKNIPISHKTSFKRYTSTKLEGGSKSTHIKAWPYALVVLLAIIGVVLLFLFSGKTKVQVSRSDLIVGGLPTVLDFYTDWCPACKEMEPIVHGLEEKYKGRISVRKVNANTDIELSREFEIQYVPTYVFLNKNGEVVERITGADIDALVNAFEKIANPKVK